MAVDYCGRQLARRLGWATPAYHKNEGETPHTVYILCKFRLQYDERPDWRFWVQVGTWNLGSLRGTGEVCEELRKRMIDMCCLQEERWTGYGFRMLGMVGRRYKFWWSGKWDGVGVVGVMVKEELCEKAVEVRMVRDRVMNLVVVLEEHVLSMIRKIFILFGWHSPTRSVYYI